MSGPFQPVGDKPRWELIYESLSGRDIGDVVTYDEFAEALELTRDEFLANRSAAYKGMNRWCADNKRAFRVVQNVGYRVVDAPEHEAIAKNEHRSARRKLRKSRQALVNADRSRLSDDERQRFDRLESTLGRHEDMIRRLDGRTAKVEKAVAESKRNQSVTDERISALEEALRRQGIDPGAAA